MSSVLRFAFLLCGLWTLSAQAQEEPLPQRLYFNSNLLLGSSRVVSLGGAYVGIAEGAAGLSSNLASVAQRSPDLDRSWDVGFSLDWIDLPLSSKRNRDIDNDGISDESPDSMQLLMGLMLQYKRFGLGFFIRNGSVSANSEPGLKVSLMTTALAGAVAFNRDEFILGLGLYGAQAVFAYEHEAFEYGNTGLALDLLYRPQGKPYRIGVAMRPEVVAKWQRGENQGVFIAGRQIYSAVASPGVLSLGVSYRIGEGSENYNRLSPAAQRQNDQPGLAAGLVQPLAPNTLTGRWLITAQLDFIGGVENAVPVRSLTEMQAVELVGGAPSFQPRAGVEHETWPGRFRSRLGAFAEPSPFDGQGFRPHLTGGFEVFLFKCWESWSFSASFDVARRYSNLGLSLGFWR